MTSPQKRKGDRAELEAAGLLADLLGYPVRRKLGAGRSDDTGDLDGVPETVIQVANYSDVLKAVRHKPLGAEQQRINAGATHAFAMVRMRGGDWRCVLTVEQMATYIREALP